MGSDKYKVTNKKEMSEAILKVNYLTNELDRVKEPLETYRNECELKRKKELWEYKTFHSMFNGYDFIYVTEVTSDSIKYFGFKQYTYPKIGYQIMLDESCTHEEFEDVSEWVGIGPIFYERINECLDMLKIKLILNNKSEKNGKN